MKKWLKKRKKGSVLIEFVVVFPFIVAMVFFGIEVLVYQLVHATAQEATKEGARVVGVELRGHRGPIMPDSGMGDHIISEEEMDYITDILKRKVNTIMNNNGFVVFDAETATYITDKEGGEMACEQAIEDGDEQVLCLYTEVVEIAGREHEQIVVRLKTVYGSFSNFVPGARLRYVEGYGTESKEAIRRFEYF